MNEIDFFGYWGYFFIFAGLYYIGAKEPAGWFMRLFGETIWIILGFILGVSSIWVGGLAFVALDFYNLQKWKMEQEDPLEVLGDRLADEIQENRRQMMIMDGTIRFSKFGVEYDVDDWSYLIALGNLPDETR